MSIETLLEAAKFVEWSAQLQHARENEIQQVHADRDKTSRPPPSPMVIVPTPPPAPSHPLPTLPVKVISKIPTSPVPPRQDATWVKSLHTSPRSQEATLVPGRPLAQQVTVPHHSPQRALTPTSVGAGYLGHGVYRALAPVPVQSPNSKSSPFIYRRLDFDSNSNQSEESNLGDTDDKKSDTREVHNKLEKNRRAHLKDCFDQLKAQVPNMEDRKIKTSNLSILQGALRYLQALKRKERDLEHQLDKLARQKITYQQRLAKLRMEKGLPDKQLSWNHDAEMEDERGNDDDDQVSTSTASEAEEEERKSRAQSPVLPVQPQPQPILQVSQPTNRTTDRDAKVRHSVTKEIHSGPYFISRQIITHIAQSPAPNRTQGTEALPIISQLAQKQAGKHVTSAFDEHQSVLGKNAPSGTVVSTMSSLPGNNVRSNSHSEISIPVAPQNLSVHSQSRVTKTIATQHTPVHSQSGMRIPIVTQDMSLHNKSGMSIPISTQYMGVNSQSGSRQTVSQLLGKQTPGVRAPARRPSSSNYTPVIQAPLRQPLTTTVYPPIPVGLVRVTTPPTTATASSVASKHRATAVTSVVVSHPTVTSSVIHSSAMAKSMTQSSVIPTSIGPTALRPISSASYSTQMQIPPNSMNMSTVAPPTVFTPRSVSPFLSPLAVQPSALTQVLFTQPPVAAYSLAQSSLANPLIPSALQQTIIRHPVTAVTQPVITQIISTQPVASSAPGKVGTISNQTVTTPTIAPPVAHQAVGPYLNQSLAALGVSPFPVTLGPPLALNKALVTTPTYTSLSLGTAGLQKLTMSPLSFQSSAIPISAGATQAAILSPLPALGAAAAAKVPTLPLSTTLLTPAAIRPRITVNPKTVAHAVTTAAGVPVAMGIQPTRNMGSRQTKPKNSGVKIPVVKKEKSTPGVTASQLQQNIGSSDEYLITTAKASVHSGKQTVKKENPTLGVTTSQLQQNIRSSNKNLITTAKASSAYSGKQKAPSNSKAVTVNQ